jgi:predicted SAM-dependent methyltransferase
VNFQQFESLPLQDKSCSCVYGSHVFEHMSIFKTPLVFKEIYRVLEKRGVFRIVLPDAEKSVREYLSGNTNFPLFKRRRERVRTMYGHDYTLFECMRDDFISRSGQAELLGNNALAHQNAWDFETLCNHLEQAGFDKNKIRKMAFRESSVDYFKFEGTYPSEANEDYRSLYVEASK